ncbi:MAG TPA: response regulator transcription factor [Steroidobacteraceae bacterium]|jgi:DNA-binding NarL/FixJ family response regulator
MSRTIRILLADDHPVVRAGYRRFLEQEPDMEVVAEASTGEEVCELLQSREVDAVVLDLRMPGQGGLATLRHIRARWPDLPLLIFSMYDALTFAMQALRAGASGYISKSSDPAVMVAAIRGAIAGTRPLSPDIANRLAAAQSAALPHAAAPVLSGRENDVLQLIAKGQNHSQISRQLGLSGKTVANYRSLIRQKLGASSDIALLRFAIETGAVAMWGDGLT